MRLDTRIVNAELARRGHRAELVKGKGYHYFTGPETEEWLDRTVKARTINTFTLKQWIEEFVRLKDLNVQILKTATRGRAGGHTPKRR
jgi:hypothetical protein